MKYSICQNKLSDDIKRKIFQGFGRQAIKSTGIDGLSEDPISFEIHDNDDFVGAVVVQLFWGQLHIKYLFVEEKYRGQGLGRQLLKYALNFGKNHGCDFAFVETMSFQAPEFYRKMGFRIEFSREGYAKNTAFHYLKKILVETQASSKVTRIGVYGVAFDAKKILLIQQKRGPFAGRFDFPGGGIEFGETPEDALRREFAEEIACDFDSTTLLDNLTGTTDVPKSAEKDSFIFYQIGLIYEISGLRPLKDVQSSELQYIWIDPEALLQENCSSLLWLWIKKHFHHYQS